MHRRTTIAAITAAAALAIPAMAGAHVTVQPRTAVAGSYTVEAVRVPNEQESAVTTKVAVRFPPGFASVAYQRVPGWSAKVTTEKLATPVQTDDGPVDTGVATITFTAGSRASGIQPGEFQDFPLSVLIPDKTGTLTFKAVQTYSDGDVVRWIGPADADEPAPTVTVVPASAATSATAPATAPASGTTAGGDGGGGSDGLSIAAIVVGGLGLIAGGWALLTTRRGRPRGRRDGGTAQEADAPA